MLDELFSDKISTSLTLGFAIVIILIINWIKNYIQLRSFFKSKNIPGPIPLPLFGNFYGVIKEGLVYHDINIVRKYGKICGYFEGSTPVIITTDPKFMKNFMIKDSSSFVNRRVFEFLKMEPSDKFLSVLKDEEWKNVRSILTTSFTSGKLKLMSKCIHECIKNYESYLKDIAENKDGIIATKFLFGSYTLDVISSCFFGLHTNSINEPENECLKNLQMIFSANTSFNPKLLLVFLAPSLAGYLVKNDLMEVFPKSSLKYLEDLIDCVIKRRKETSYRRDDFIQNIMEHEEKPGDQHITNKDQQDHAVNDESKNEDKSWIKWNKPLKKTLTNKEMCSQAISFLGAGYETTSTTLEFIAYNLAMNQNVQERLIKEIDRILEKHNGEVNYDSIADMKYMDMVIDETLRMYPPGTRLDRVASNDYEYNGFKIEKGQVIMVPIFALHHDPDVYPNPDVFDPERFNEENIKTRDNLAFIPFGAGPRNCIGMRFALMEIKMLLSTILSKYQIEKCDKTPDAITIDNSGFTRPTKPLFVKLKIREINSF